MPSSHSQLLPLVGCLFSWLSILTDTGQLLFEIERSFSRTKLTRREFIQRFDLHESRNARCRQTRSTSCADFWRSASILAEARLHLLRRTDRPDRHHANRAGRKKEMDQPIAFSSRVELLHASARTGGAAAGDL